MTYRDQSYDLAVQYDAHGFELDDDQKARFDEDLDRLATILRRGPAATLHVDLVRHARTGDIHVKTTLRIDRGPAFFTGERGRLPSPAFKRCVHKLIRKVEEFRRRAEQQRQDVAQRSPRVRSEVEPDWATIANAVEDADYVTFRRAVHPYEDSLHLRVGRAIERFPEAAAVLGDRILISEVVEEVFLNAFEGFADGLRSKLTLSAWLESLIEPSIEALLADPETEKENVAFVRSLVAG
jgi:hypothetical protein